MDLIRARPEDAVLASFRDDVGVEDPVCVAGGRTRWDVGGLPRPGTREVRAPSGIVAFEPAELVVRVRAGTTVADLDRSLAPAGQCVALPDAPGSTVGGVLAVGRSGLRALGWGPVRATLLEATYVDAWGRLVRAGAPVVKNVTGFDLCRLLVGSLGTIGLLGEVVLRTRPRPASEAWCTGPAGAEHLAAVRAAAGRPTTVLWDGGRVWIRNEGHAEDVAAATVALGELGCGDACDGPPPLPPVRSSLPPAAVRELPVRWPGRFVAEVGVGIVHADVPAAVAPLDERLVRLHREVKARFDPDGRLNPGRSPLAVVGSAGGAP